MNRITKFADRILLVIALGLGCLHPAIGAAQQERGPAKDKSEGNPSSDAQEQAALVEAIQASNNNPQAAIEKLESFLQRFPYSSRREVVLRAICNFALVANAPDVVLKYGPVLLEIAPDEPRVLNQVIDALGRKNDQASRNLAIDYNSRLIKIAEAGRDREAISGGSKDAVDEWTKRIAAKYTRQGKLYKESGDIGQAVSSYEKSYSTYPSAEAAEGLGDLASEKGDSARALDYYLTAFAFPEENPAILHRREVRRKLGSTYFAQHHTEDGLGDLALARYDTLIVQLAGRFSSNPQRNAGIEDPFKFVVEKLDGTPLPMADFQGKVLVVDFWATWCGPCRVQGRLLDQVAQTFHGDSRIKFIALNVDEDRSGVGAFVKEAGWTVPVAYAQGLEQLLKVGELPTLVVFDPQGRIVDHEGGLFPATFTDELTKRLRTILQDSAEPKSQ